MARKPEKIVILGAGPAGLAAGWKLAAAGKAVEIIELENKVGGMCRSIDRGEFTFDLGGHRLITQDETLLSSIKTLMGDDLTTNERKSVIRLRDQFYQYPLNTMDLITKMNPFVSAKCLADFVLTTIWRRLSTKEDLSFKDWCIGHFGHSLYRIYFEPYTTKLWGISPDQISADWAVQRISLLNLWDVIARLLGKKKNLPKTYTTRFYYPRKGIGQICTRMAEEIEKKGGTILLDAAVREIELDETRVHSVFYESGNHLRETKGDIYISTIPLTDTVRAIRPAVDKNIMEATSGLRFRSVRFLNLIIDRPRISDNTWIYIPEPKYFFFRIQEPKNWHEDLAPAEKTSMILEISCNADDEIWNASDEEIFERCMAGVEDLGLFDRSDVLDYFSTFVKHGYPIYDLSYRRNLLPAQSLLKGIDNLISMGRQGLFRYNNMDHSMKMGFITADHILEGSLKAKIFDIAADQLAFEIERNTDERE